MTTENPLAFAFLTGSSHRPPTHRRGLLPGLLRGEREHGQSGDHHAHCGAKALRVGVWEVFGWSEEAQKRDSGI